jgi:hypothetical protein
MHTIILSLQFLEPMSHSPTTIIEKFTAIASERAIEKAA